MHGFIHTVQGHDQGLLHPFLFSWFPLLWTFVFVTISAKTSIIRIPLVSVLIFCLFFFGICCIGSCNWWLGLTSLIKFSSFNGPLCTVYIVNFITIFIYIGNEFTSRGWFSSFFLVLIPFIVVIVSLPSALGQIIELSPVNLGTRTFFRSLLVFVPFAVVMSSIVTESIQSDSVQLLINQDSGNI